MYLFTSVACLNCEEYAETLRDIYRLQRRPNVISNLPVDEEEFIEPWMTKIITTPCMQERKVTMDDLTSLPYGSTYLIEGRPGIGKTWLACRLRDQWVKKERLTNYPLLLFMKLREVEATQPGQDKLTLLENFLALTCHESCCLINKMGGKGVFIGI